MPPTGVAGVGSTPVAAPGTDAAAHPPAEADSGDGAGNAGRAVLVVPVSAGDQEAVWAAAEPGERWSL